MSELIKQFEEPIIDTINGMGSLETSEVVVKRLHNQMVDKVGDYKNKLLLLVLIAYILKYHWTIFSTVVGCDDFEEYMERILGVGVETTRKYIRFGTIIDRNWSELGSILKDIGSLYSLDYYERARKNHSKDATLKALVSESQRGFKLFSQRRPFYAEISAGKKDKVMQRTNPNSSISRYIDTSRYNAISKPAINQKDEILTIGTPDQKVWDLCLEALRAEGIDYDIYEEGTAYSSIRLKAEDRS